MSKGRTFGYLMGSAMLLLGASNAAWAVNYSGMLAYDSKPPVAVTFQTPFGPVSGNVGLDLDRFNLGNALGDAGSNVTFTTHNSYNPNTSVIAVLFATDPNDAVFNDPASLASLVSPTTDLTSFLNANVTGWQYAVLGNTIVSNGTTNLSTVFTPPISFTAGTTYYAFVAGGAAYSNGALAETGMSYTLSVGAPSAVPEPQTWATLGAGIGMIAMMLRRRSAN